MDQLHIGHLVTVGCIQRLWQEVAGTTTVNLGRPAVEGSIVTMNQERQPLDFRQINSQAIELTAPPNGKAYMGYCPVLKTRLIDFQLKMEEWKHMSSWKLVLEEV